MNTVISHILAGALMCLASVGIVIVMVFIVASLPFEEPEE